MTARPTPRTPAPNPAADQALERGLRALEALERPELTRATAESLITHDSPWIAAWCLIHAPSPSTPSPPWAQRFLSFLDRHRSPSGGWPSTCSVETRQSSPTEDLETTLLALEALERQGQPDRATAEPRLLALDTAALLALDPTTLAWALALDCRIHPESRGSAALAQAEEHLVAQIRRQGLATRSTASPYLLAHALTGWLTQAPTGEPFDEVRGRVVWDALWRLDEALASPLDSALLLADLLALGPDWGPPDWFLDLERLAGVVAEHQAELGLWPALPLAATSDGEVLGSLVFTSTLAVHALDTLGRARSQPAYGSDLERSWHRSFRANPLKRGAIDRPLRFADLEANLRPLVDAIPEALVSRPAFDELRRLARQLPGPLTHGFGLECRLGEDRPRADFLLCITDHEEGREVLAGTSPHAELAPALLATEAWGKVRELCRRWRRDDSPLHGTVGDIWLEFDAAGGVPEVPIPSLFFCLRELRIPEPPDAVAERLAEYRRIADEALGAVAPGSLPEGFDPLLERCLRAIPPGAYPYAWGLMLARSTEAIRLCVKDLATEAIVPYLEAIDWPGDLAALTDLLSEIGPKVDRIHVDVDLGSRLYPTLGLECSYFDHRPPALEPRWYDFLRALVDRGLCRPAKAEAFLAWPGKLHCVDHQAEGGGRAIETYFDKLLGHVKLGLKPEGGLEAKGYFGAWRAVSRPRTVSPSPSSSGAGVEESP